jgi:hypothetical protein
MCHLWLREQQPFGHLTSSIVSPASMSSMVPPYTPATVTGMSAKYDAGGVLAGGAPLARSALCSAMLTSAT